ncbi:MAG: polysaccharide deacetylase family protein [Gemmatimonadota bacterium]
MNPLLAVLRFRRVEERDRGQPFAPHAVPPRAFARALAWIQRNGWTVLDAHRLLQGLDESDHVPERSVLITIDGPYRSLIRDALPILRAHSLPAVVFVPVHFIGREAVFEAESLPSPVCTLNDLRYLEDQGVSVQSQGVSSRSFDVLSEPEREWEMMRSRQALEAALQRPVEMFAFPRGDPGPDPVASAETARRCGYRAAFVCRGSVNRLAEADRFRLARVTVGPATDLADALGRQDGSALA